MEGATDLSELLGGQPVQSPAFHPMTTGGGDPFSAPLNTTPPKEKFTDYSHQFSVLRGSIRGLFSYIAFFLAAFVISLAWTREQVARIVPHLYLSTDGGLLSYSGAGIMSALACVLAYVFNTVFYNLL